MSVRAVKLHSDDLVANVLAAVQGAGIDVLVEADSPQAVQQQVTAQGPIPFGHKIALEDMTVGTPVLKYGYPIGVAKSAIRQGEHVHVHNVEGLPPTHAIIPGREEPARYGAEAVRKFVQSLGQAHGLPPETGGDLADSLVEAELTGCSTHGLRRLPAYLQRISSAAVDALAAPALRADDSIIWVDGRNALGQHVIRVAADAAVEVAEERGLGLALVNNSNHCGALGVTATRIAAHGMVALVVSNGPACVAPPEGSRPFLSNSPIAIAAPRADGSCYVVDLATSVTSRDHIRRAAALGASIPSGWALDAAGSPTVDAQAAMSGTVLPLGGARGFALITGLEVLAGLLPNALTDVQVPPKDAAQAAEGIGHFVLAISLDRAPEGASFAERLQAMERRLLGLERPKRSAAPRLPGVRRTELRQERLQQGLPLPDDVVAHLREIGAEHDVSFPRSIEGGS